MPEPGWGFAAHRNWEGRAARPAKRSLLDWGKEGNAQRRQPFLARLGQARGRAPVWGPARRRARGAPHHESGQPSVGGQRARATAGALLPIVFRFRHAPAADVGVGSCVRPGGDREGEPLKTLRLPKCPSEVLAIPTHAADLFRAGVQPTSGPRCHNVGAISSKVGVPLKGSAAQAVGGAAQGGRRSRPERRREPLKGSAEPLNVSAEPSGRARPDKPGNETRALSAKWHSGRRFRPSLGGVDQNWRRFMRGFDQI